MGKRGKKPQRPRRLPLSGDDGDDDGCLPSSAYDLPLPRCNEEQEEDDGNRDQEQGEELKFDSSSKFELYQRSVQSPKGDISYLQKFFLMYVGGRAPLHLQEDFCGTALISAEWLRSDPRRTAVGLDMDLEALNWCLENNLTKVGADANSRISLFHGNVLQPQEACHIKARVQDLVEGVISGNRDDHSDAVELTAASYSSDILVCSASSDMERAALPNRDIVCALNYSCCCLQRRRDLVQYFNHAFHALSRRGGIFVMDLYGGTSSERKLRLQRRFSNFTYVWEQAEFDILSRRTRISLHFHLGKQILRHAFTYEWRLWSIPEIKDCLEEAGFQAVHMWIREMPDTHESGYLQEYSVGHDVKYEEMSSLQQQDAWNAYIVGVANV